MNTLLNIWYLIKKNLFTFYRLPLHAVYCFLAMQKLSSLKHAHFLFFAFVFCAFSVRSKQTIAKVYVKELLCFVFSLCMLSPFISFLWHHVFLLCDLSGLIFVSVCLKEQAPIHLYSLFLTGKDLLLSGPGLMGFSLGSQSPRLDETGSPCCCWVLSWVCKPQVYYQVHDSPGSCWVTGENPAWAGLSLNHSWEGMEPGHRVHSGSIGGP